MKSVILLLLIVGLPASLWGGTVGIFYDTAAPQQSFAAGDVKSALEAKGFTVEMKSLSALGTPYGNRKVIIALNADTAVTSLLTAQSGTVPTGLGEQAYGLRTTAVPSLSYWVLGGDATGAMYGGFQIAENIKINGFVGTYHSQESPTILKRGIKLNLPWDKNSGTYGKSDRGSFDGTSAQLAIKDVWDMTFWTGWFDEMARNRYNTVSLWSCNPFSSLVKVPGYEDCSIQNVTYYDGTVKAMTMDQKIKFWQDVMACAQARGFDFLLINWNVFTYGATGKYGIKDEAENPKTIDYMYKAMIQLLETYPDLDGFGVTNGENGSTEEYLWDTCGKAMYDHARVNTSRNLRFIHRLHYGDYSAMMTLFSPLIKLDNVMFDTSVKHSQAHMYSTTTPTNFSKQYKTIGDSGLKTWLTVRNDDFYYLTWGDTNFARAYVKGMLAVGNGNIFRGFYMGCDGYNPTRTFFSKNSAMNGQLEVIRQQYMMMLWGRLSYNPATTDDVFVNYLRLKYPSVNANDLFTAWGRGSRGIQRATELISGSSYFDFHWYPEACQRGRNSSRPFVTIADFIGDKPALGSAVASISDSASDNLRGKKSSYAVADEMQADANSALSIVNGMNPGSNAELDVAINNIKAMSLLSLYYANKIRGATDSAAGINDKAKESMLAAHGWWRKYVNLMDTVYTPMDMQRTEDIDSWHAHDAAVWKEYTDIDAPVTVVKPGDVALIGRWARGASRAIEVGSKRALVVMLYGEGSNNISASSVTYGGQAMTKVVEKSFSTGTSSYTGAFVLNEAGMEAATSGTIDVTWSGAPSVGSEITSAFFSNADQSSLTGAFASHGLVEETITTSALANKAGDMVIVGGTGANDASYTINHAFRRGIPETSASFGDITSAYKTATGVSETPSLTMSSSRRQTIVGFVLKKAGVP